MHLRSDKTASYWTSTMTCLAYPKFISSGLSNAALLVFFFKVSIKFVVKHRWLNVTNLVPLTILLVSGKWVTLISKNTN